VSYPNHSGKDDLYLDSSVFKIVFCYFIYEVQKETFLKRALPELQERSKNQENSHKLTGIVGSQNLRVLNKKGRVNYSTSFLQ